MFWKKEEKSLGQIGEDIVAKHLKKKGYKIVDRNYKNKIGRQVGEIDIIAQKGEEIVFVEVKTRNLENYSGTLPEENITPAKLHKLSKIAAAYVKQKNIPDTPYHFDAVSVWLSVDKKTYEIKHLESIFI